VPTANNPLEEKFLEGVPRLNTSIHTRRSGTFLLSAFFRREKRGVEEFPPAAKVAKENTKATRGKVMSWHAPIYIIFFVTSHHQLKTIQSS